MSHITFSGLSSGIDFNQLIDALIDAQRAPVRLVQNQRFLATTRKGLFSDIETALTDLNTATGKLMDKTESTKSTAASSETSIVTATGTGDAATGVFKVTVQQLATATRVTSGFSNSAIFGLGGGIDSDQPAASSAAKFGVTPTNGTFTVNGTPFTIDATTDSLNSILSAIQTQTGVTASFDSTNDVVRLTSTSSIQLGAADDTSNFLTVTSLLASTETTDGKNFARQSTVHAGRVRPNTSLTSNNFHMGIAGDSSGNGKFKINSVEVTYNVNSDTLLDVVGRINQKATNVIASYDPTTDRLALTSKSTGSISISRQDVTGNFLEVTGLLDNGYKAKAIQTIGKNAQVIVDGFNDEQTIYSNSNTVTGVIPGVTLNLLKADATKTGSVTVGRDKATLKSTIQEYVNKFNSATALIHKRLSEQRIFQPDTDAQRRQGLLTGNALLSRIRRDLVSDASGAVSGLAGSLNQLASIGISLSSNPSGELKVDQTKLDKKLDSDFNGVFSLFFNDIDNDGTVDAGEDGVAVRVNRLLNEMLSTKLISFGRQSAPSGALLRAQKQLGDETTRLTKRIDTMEDRLAQQTLRLRNRFAAVERTISYFQSRLLGSTSQLSGLSGGSSFGQG